MQQITCNVHDISRITSTVSILLHCHSFNIVSIPLWKIKQSVNVSRNYTVLDKIIEMIVVEKIILTT